MVVFDGKALNLKPKDLSTFGTGDIGQTLDRLRPAIKGVFEFKKNKTWEPIDVSSLDVASVE